MKHQPTGENENLNYGTEHAEIIYNQSPDKRDENLLSQQQEKEKNKKQISKLKSKLEREETAEIASNTTQKVYDELQKLYTKGKLSNEEIISNTRKMINHLHQ
ncbi:MAG: hypothetical protein LBI53_01665 [Candidatus Peribacteria bacterium]|jgi:aspartate/glutamate racemase|nr:hypothetical protein [Candidatus Peribacteria bacterium]